MNGTVIESPWLDRRQGAAYAGVGLRTFDKWAHEEGLRVARVGQIRRFRREWIDEFLDSRADGHRRTDQ